MISDEVSSFLRYATVGIVLNTAALGANMALVLAGLGAWQAVALVYPVVVCASFLVNRRWSFGNRPRSHQQFLRYAIVYIASYPVAVGVVWVGTRLGLIEPVSIVLSIIVSALLIFAGLSYWVFARAGGSMEGDQRVR